MEYARCMSFCLARIYFVYSNSVRVFGFLSYVRMYFVYSIGFRIFEFISYIRIHFVHYIHTIILTRITESPSCMYVCMYVYVHQIVTFIYIFVCTYKIVTLYTHLYTHNREMNYIRICIHTTGVTFMYICVWTCMRVTFMYMFVRTFKSIGSCIRCKQISDGYIHVHIVCTCKRVTFTRT